MALLSAEDRVRVRALWNADGHPGLLEKPDFQAAVAAADQWTEDNTADYVAALPAAFAANTTATQKALLLMYVLLRRMGRM